MKTFLVLVVLALAVFGAVVLFFWMKDSILIAKKRKARTKRDAERARQQRRERLGLRMHV